MKNKKSSKGFTMTELAFVLVIGGIIISVGLIAFNKMYSPALANSEYGKVMQAIGAAERAASDAQGAYPAYPAATAIASATLVADQMGGNTSDLSGWLYGCPTGGTIVTLTTGTMPSSTIASLLVQKVNGSSPTWVATNTAGVVTIVRNSITCL